jgi:putative phosphoesterase
MEIAGKRILLTHGHLYGVKKGLLNLYYRGKEVEADLVVFGHTHAWTLEKMEDILLFNPGSASRPRKTNPTLGLIIINKEKIEVQKIEI